MKTEENIRDLFEHLDELPTEIIDILEKYSEWDETYEVCENLKRELNNVGYTCEYYLDAIPYNLVKL